LAVFSAASVRSGCHVGIAPGSFEQGFNVVFLNRWLVAVVRVPAATHILRALARAREWCQKLEAGKMNTFSDLAAVERLSDRFVSRQTLITET